jgi:hypothetical protein
MKDCDCGRSYFSLEIHNRKYHPAPKPRYNGNWLGDRATYNAIHVWHLRHWKKSGCCEWCGAGVKVTDWANLSGKYLRDDPTDWAELCRSCHQKYDRGRKLQDGFCLCFTEAN